MGLEERYPELIALPQFFPTTEDVEWRAHETSFSGDCDVLYVYGFSPQVEPLITWLDQDEKRDLVFIEDRIEAIKKMEEESIFDHPQVHLRFYLGEVDLDEFVSGVVQTFPFEKIQVMNLHENSERFEELKILLFRKATLEAALHTEMIYAHQLTKNLIQNFRRLPDAFDVGLWKDKFKDVPAVICGAGPSLQTVEKELKGLSDKALILAGGSTIAALSAKGIMPHLLYAIDPNPEEFSRLAFQTAYDVPLIFGCRLEPNVFYSHAGPIGYLPTGTGGALEKWMEEKLGIHDYQVLKGLGEEALSVTTIAFMTAIHFGCNPIILAGVDLAYENGNRYTPGIVSDLQCALEEKPKKAGDTVWYKEELSTLTKWIMERDVLDAVCPLFPDRIFMKASPKGLPFKNIPFDPNWHRHKKRDLNVYEAVTETALNIQSEDVENHLKSFFVSMKSCKWMVEEIVQELKQLYPNMEGKETTPKTMVLEMDLEEEIAFKTVLKPAVYALTFKMQKEKRPSYLPRNLYLIKLEVYLRLKAIIDQYLVLA